MGWDFNTVVFSALGKGFFLEEVKVGVVSYDVM